MPVIRFCCCKSVLACVFADKSCFATLHGLVTLQYVSVLPATMHPCLYCYLSDVTALVWSHSSAGSFFLANKALKETHIAHFEVTLLFLVTALCSHVKKCFSFFILCSSEGLHSPSSETLLSLQAPTSKKSPVCSDWSEYTGLSKALLCVSSDGVFPFQAAFTCYEGLLF